jgi:hypothetical protein
VETGATEFVKLLFGFDTNGTSVFVAVIERYCHSQSRPELVVHGSNKKHALIQLPELQNSKKDLVPQRLPMLTE